MANHGQFSRSNERNLTSNSIGIHRMSSSTATSSLTNNNRDKELVTLQNPRPNKLRDTNDYFDVNQPKFKSENVLTATLTNQNQRTSALRLQSTTKNEQTNNNNNNNNSVRSSFDPCRRSSSADRGRLYSSSDSWNSSHFNDFVRVQIHSKLPSTSISSLPSTQSSSKLINQRTFKNNDNKLSSNQNLNVIVGPGRPIRLSKATDSSNVSSHSVISSSPRKPRKSQDSLTTNVNDSIGNGFGANRSKQSSNLCPRCNRCRCVGCTTSKTIPSKWICGNHYLCSLDTTVDLLSCMCCVKGCLYHTMGNDEEGQNGIGSHSISSSSDVDECQQQTKCSSNCCLRWTIAGFAASLIMPCLLCYYPLKCCAKMVSNGYARYHDYGCRCVERRPGSTVVIGRQPPSRSSSANILPPPFPESNFEQSTKLTSGGCGGVVVDETNPQLFTIHKPP